MNIFIDGIKLIRIESYDYIHQIEVNQHRINWLKNEGFNQFFVTEEPLDLHMDDHIIINGERYPLQIGIVTLTKEFDETYRYDGALGYTYHKDHTDFAVFSPVAKEINLILDGKAYPMYYEKPVWKTTVDQDCHMLPYHFQVRLVDTFKDVKDPYTKACSTTESYVVDFSQLNQALPTPIKLKKYTDAVLYEAHVRDLTIALDDINHQGLFAGLLEHSKTLKGNVIDYVKQLGMTHLQFLPIYDFEGVNDIHRGLSYNWGYNPSQYFAVEGWYSEFPDDPKDRINQLINVVNYAHKIGLGVNMDVVYNHVFNHRTYPYDALVPGYFYRHNQAHKMTDSSYCGNDVETRHYMVRKLIVDSLIHFATIYQMDGFRFDLMGLLDLDTMHDIERELKKINPSIMLYGEGWNMTTEVPQKLRSNMANQSQFKSIAHFNDFYRNTLKGELHGPGLGYATGNQQLISKAMESLIGSPHLFSSPLQSINYVECHDNLTFYDKMLLSCGYQCPDFAVYQDLANHMIAISQGIPFYHAGQEFYRTKLGVENSYNSPDEINKILWNPNSDGVKKLRKLLKLRKQYAVYRQSIYGDHVTVSKNGHLIVYTLHTKAYDLVHYIKQDKSLEKIALSGGKLIFPSQKALTEEPNLFVDQPGVYIIKVSH